MRIKVFYPNNDGKIEFTKEELEKLINDVYNEGKSDGRSETRQPIIELPPVIYPPYTFNTTTTPAIVPNHTEITCSNDSTISYQATNGEVLYTNDDSIGRIYLQSGTLSELGMKGGTGDVN